MRFQVKRQCAGERAVFAQDKKMRGPAGFCAGASGLVQRMQEFMPQERIVAGEPVPLARGNRGNRVADFDNGFGRFHGNLNAR